VSEPRVEDYEKLGAFYLGREWNSETGALREDLLLYDSKDLTTHGVCVGMTGSGKTGLCVTLLEEAAIDGIPALVIDLKGDLVNLLLTFPELAPEDFRPWVDPGAAARKGMTPDAYAANRAGLWRKGLADWGQDGERIQRLKDAADFAVYTPGSDAGRPLTILKSFTAPPPEILEDADALRDRIQGTVSGLLALLGIQADPVRSREHILISTILDRSWRAGKSLDLAGLIRAIQAPGFDRIGVFELDSFFPAGDRLGLAMSVNNLLASPGFSSWMQGEPLDIGRLLWTEKGRPRVSILSIAHLSESERMFFLTIFLNEVVAWMRGQPGTSTLRALLYMDEVFGYLPPTANPPSKKPLLTLLKQARAYGLGCLLATQNPVDLDYKALSNAGTWFLGRLQTERDKLRVLDGLEGAAATTGARFDRAAMERTLSGLDSRVFVMNNAHEDGPVVFHTRWAMSYLAGPMTRNQIRQLVGEEERAAASAAQPTAALATPAAVKRSQAAAKRVAARPVEPELPEPRPLLPDGVREAFLPLEAADGDIIYRPALSARATLHFADARRGIDEWREFEVLAELDEDTASDPWEEMQSFEPDALFFEDEPAVEARFDELPRAARRKTSYRSWASKLKSELYQRESIDTFSCKSPKATSKPGENEGDFRARLRALADEKRDLEVEKLRTRYEKKLGTLKGRLMRAEQKIEVQKAQYSEKKTSTVISIGKTLLGALFGRKLASAGTIGSAATTAGRMSRAAKERGDIARAEESLAAVQADIQELDERFQEDVAELEERFSAENVEILTKTLRPRKSDTEVEDLRLVWTPWIIDRRGRSRPAFEV
jgi:hypothetical protein